MRRLILVAAVVLGGSAFAAEQDTFYGWSKDGTWFVFQTVSGPNDLTELFFCITDETVTPSWPKDLNDMDRMDHPHSCVRFQDPNRAPYGWKTNLVLPKPTTGGPNNMKVLSELSQDGERPGFVVEDKAGKHTTCYVSVKEDSKLGNVWWHPNGKWVAAMIDKHFVHCDQPLKGGAADAEKPEKPVKKGGGKKGKG
ncbi:MAG: hypothetical protein QM723_25860 [Myxococcaceae bacterium]